MQHDAQRHSVARLLLSHHPPEHAHRTVTLGWGRCRVQVCARCLGMLIGLLLVGVLVGVGPALPAGQPLWWCILPLSLPAMVDFHGQLMRRWESRNLRRLASGAAFGAALALSLGEAAAGRWVAALVVPAVLAGYFAWLPLGRRRLARARQHLRRYVAYYDRCRAEDARHAVEVLLSGCEKMGNRSRGLSQFSRRRSPSPVERYYSPRKWDCPLRPQPTRQRTERPGG